MKMKMKMKMRIKIYLLTNLTNLTNLYYIISLLSNLLLFCLLFDNYLFKYYDTKKNNKNYFFFN